MWRSIEELLRRRTNLSIAVKTNTGRTPKLHWQHLDSIDQKLEENDELNCQLSWINLQFTRKKGMVPVLASSWEKKEKASRLDLMSLSPVELIEGVSAKPC